VRGGQVPGVIMHTDRGSEYTATLVRQACARLSISQSMGRPGSELPRVFRTGNLRLIHAAVCISRYSSITSCGVR
jgi:hypothetical protein